MELAAEDLDPDTPGGDAVYDFVRRAADWAGLLPPGGTFSVNSHVWDCSQLNNSVLVRVLPRETVRLRAGSHPATRGRVGGHGDDETPPVGVRWPRARWSAR